VKKINFPLLVIDILVQMFMWRNIRVWLSDAFYDGRPSVNQLIIPMFFGKHGRNVFKKFGDYKKLDVN